MRFLLVAVLLLALSPGLASAQTANPLPPGASTTDATDVAQSTATVNGTVDPNGAATTYRFQYGTTTSYGLTSPTQTLPAGTAGVSVHAGLSHLTAATTYHFRVTATNAAGTTAGADKSFRTAAAPSRPAVRTTSPTAIAADGATLQARVDPNRQATTYAFDYGTSTRYGKTTPSAAAGAGDSSVAASARIGGLTANTLYHVRVRASNATGSTTGSDVTFRTAKVPLVIGVSASTSSVRYGGSVTITGTVTGTDRSGVPLVLERRNAPFDTGFRPFGGQQNTDATGVVHFIVPPFTIASQFRLRAPTRGNLTSAPVTVAVRAFVRLHVQRLRHGRLRLSGTVSPGGASGTVSIQRLGLNGRYTTVRRAALTTRTDVSRFSVVVLARRKTTTYRVATRLSGSTLANGRSLPRRIAPR